MILPKPSIEKEVEKSRERIGNIIFGHSDSFGISGLYSAVWTGMDAYSEALLTLTDD